MQDERLANIGSPPKESGVARTLSKFRSVKSGFGALNALHRINDLSLQVGTACPTFYYVQR